jgi:hypothetical protein
MAQTERERDILIAAQTYAEAFSLWSDAQRDDSLSVTMREETIYRLLVHAEEQLDMIVLEIWGYDAMTLDVLFDYAFRPHHAGRIRDAVAHLRRPQVPQS